MTSTVTLPEDRAAQVLQRVVLDVASSSEYRLFFGFARENHYVGPEYVALVRNLVPNADARTDTAHALNQTVKGIMGRLELSDDDVARTQDAITILFCS